jgi:HD-like signal output (HDOD) protein
LDLVKEKSLSVTEAEEALSAPRHTIIGRELVTKWRLPAVFQAVTSHHHQRDPELRGGLSSEMNQVVDIVYLANLLVHALQFGHSGHSKVIGVPRDVLDRMQLNSQKLVDLISKIKESVGSAENFLKVIGG